MTSPEPQPLERTQHRNLVTGTDLGGSTVHRESRVDIEDYLEPITAVRTKALHGPGVATGLHVTATKNQPGLRITPGVAIDQAGRTVALQDGSVAVTDPNADATTARNVPTVDVTRAGVTVDTAGLTGERVLTVAWAEAEAGGATLLRHAPWLQLLPAGDRATGADAVPLAQVSLDAAGAVTALTAGSRATLFDRLRIQAARASGSPALAVDQTPAAELRARPDGGLDIALGGTTTPALSLLGTGDLTVTGVLTAERSTVVALTATSLSSGTLTINGATTLTGVTTVGGPLTATSLRAGTLRVEGATTLTGTTTAAALTATSLKAGTLTIDGATTLTGTTTAAALTATSLKAGTLTIDGATTLTGTTTAAALTATSLKAGTLTIDGATTLTGTTTAAALTATSLKAGTLTIDGATTLTGGLRVGAGGGLLNQVTIGTAGGVPVANPPYAWDYETVGVNRPEHNLRLRSPNVIAAHTWDPASTTYLERVRIGGESTVARLTIGPGANGRLWTRHIDGKHWQQDTNDGLFLNWDTRQPVMVGGGARADLRVSGDAVVGAGGDGALTVRHVRGKSGANDNPDDLFLNWNTGRGVHVGGGAPAPLNVHGELRVDAAVSTPGITLGPGGTIGSTGRMHVSGEELLFLLHKQGVIVSTAWGGNGRLRADGNLGSAGKDPVAGLPTGWGGGVHTWDVFSEGTIGCGPAGIDGNAVPAGLNRDGAVWGKSKRFVIDHPLDPEHRRLAHACVEGPEIGVYYRGDDRLVDGRARVELPDYFESLVRSEARTVLLTPIVEGDEPVSMLAAGVVGNGGFDVRAIDGSNPSQRFYWEVKAVRADVEPLQVELRKNQDRTLRHGTAGDTELALTAVPASAGRTE